MNTSLNKYRLLVFDGASAVDVKLFAKDIAHAIEKCGYQRSTVIRAELVMGTSTDDRTI
jgi:hypothetical protein